MGDSDYFGRSGRATTYVGRRIDFQKLNLIKVPARLHCLTSFRKLLIQLGIPGFGGRSRQRYDLRRVDHDRMDLDLPGLDGRYYRLRTSAIGRVDDSAY
jgi:hypothetical protein